MTLVWTIRAKRELLQQFVYIGQDDLPAARRQTALVIQAAETLTRFPTMGKPGRVKNTREFFVPQTSFFLVYRVKAQKLRILALLHARQNWPRSF